MSCFHPLRAFPVGFHDSGKVKYRICSQDVDFVTNSEGIRVDRAESIQIPCGKCIGCRLDKSKEWAQRCMLELQYHNSAYFITLTYDDVHLPMTDIIDSDGCIIQSPIHTLRKRDLQLFMKRLRKNSGQDLRFFGCGEYGDSTHRPHYHIIVFGLELSDLKIYKQNFQGDFLYNSSLIEKCWKYGYSVVAEVTWESCAYVARYVTKKLTGKASEYYELFNIEPPFINMSRRPGIAFQYFEDNKHDIYHYDKIFMSTKNGGLTLRPSKYFDKKYDIEYPSDMALIKDKRAQIADYMQRLKISESGLDYSDILAMDEEILYKKLGKVLERSTI